MFSVFKNMPWGRAFVLAVVVALVLGAWGVNLGFWDTLSFIRNRWVTTTVFLVAIIWVGIARLREHNNQPGRGPEDDPNF